MRQIPTKKVAESFSGGKSEWFLRSATTIGLLPGRRGWTSEWRILTRSFVAGKAALAVARRKGIGERRAGVGRTKRFVRETRNNNSVPGGFGRLRFSLAVRKPRALACGRTCRFRPAKSYLVTASPFRCALRSPHSVSAT